LHTFGLSIYFSRFACSWAMFFRFSRACFCVLEIYAFDAGKAPSVENIGDRHKCHMACNALIMPTRIYIYVYVSTYRWMPHAKDAYRLSPLELGQCERHCLLGRLRRRDNNNKLLHLPRDRYSGAMGWGAEVFTGVTKLSISLIT